MGADEEKRAADEEKRAADEEKRAADEEKAAADADQQRSDQAHLLLQKMSAKKIQKAYRARAAKQQATTALNDLKSQREKLEKSLKEAEGEERQARPLKGFFWRDGSQSETVKKYEDAQARVAQINQDIKALTEPIKDAEA